ncbi:hypothetical protein LPB140_12095 [Sphingorhabdus lutea]|uniref:Uncharacterized protein n=1 Tax=Sphingorhabdus lutea TaxID=1913578 RepID=A0A1L3JE50_9SPHN|nr:hypothetical protein [Sphingorhabdus lutea]APG63404.1 hypothetical protein LPB140_12095 [Sphingorhabdus lutea]
MAYGGGQKIDNLGQLKAAYDNPGRYKMLFLYGPDESEISYIVKKFLAHIGNNVEHILLNGDQLRSDPALLSDEANAISLFGEKKIIHAEIKRDEAMTAIEYYLQGPAGEHVVLVQSGNLTKANKLRKLVEADKSVLSLIVYEAKSDVLFGRLNGHAKSLGLIVKPDLIRAILARVNMNIHLAMMEMEKLSLYHDASIDNPKKLRNRQSSTLQRIRRMTISPP